MSEHPLSGFSSDSEAYQRQKDGSYEERTVNYLISRYKLTGLKHSLMKTQNSLTGSWCLTLAVFHANFPDFPIHLSAAKIPYLAKDCETDKLFNRFSTRKMVKRYEENLELVPEEYAGRSGLVLYWPYISRGMILHTDQTAISENPGVRLVWTRKLKGKRTDSLMVLEPLPQYLDGLGWGPDAESEDAGEE